MKVPKVSTKDVTAKLKEELQKLKEAHALCGKNVEIIAELNKKIEIHVQNETNYQASIKQLNIDLSSKS